MLILVTGDTVTIEEPTNFRAFKIVAQEGQPLDRVAAALTGLAEVVDAGHAWVSEQALRSWSSLADDPAWQSGLSAMIEKARPHGWIDPDRNAIRAHIEWRPTDTATP
jgi:hypothetical protein